MNNVRKIERYSEMKDSGTAWLKYIPFDWKVSQIGSLYIPRNERVSDKEYPPLSVTMKGIVPQLASAAKTDDGDNRKLVRVGDFAINSRSDRRGSCGVSSYDGSVSLINTVLTPRKSMHSGYYNWLFHTDAFADEFYKWGHGIVDDLWTTRWQEMKRIKVPVPRYAVQQAIATFLDTECRKLDEVIAELKISVDDYKQWRTAIITKAVTKGIDPNVEMADTDIFWIGAIPKHWRLEKLKRYTSMLTPMRDKPEHLDGDIPWIRIEDYDGKYISSSKEGLGVSQETVTAMNLKVYPVGTILCTSSCDLGKCAIVARELVSNQRFIGIIPNDNIYPDYLYYLMLSNAKRLNYLSTGSIQANLSRVAFEQLLVQVPPFDEQVEIATFLDEKISLVDALINEKANLISDLESYKKSLIYEVVTGKRKVV